MRMPFGGHGHGHAMRGAAASRMRRLPAPNPQMQGSGATGLPPAAQAQKMGGPTMKPKMSQDQANPMLG